MLECCKNLAKPVISISRDGLVIKAWYEDYPEDFLEIKGEYGRDIFENGLLTLYEVRISQRKLHKTSSN